MAEFLVEIYAPGLGAAGLSGVAARVRETAEAMSLEGVPVRYVRPILVPEDETCFHLVEAASREAALETARRAGLEDPRITETIESGYAHHRSARAARQPRWHSCEDRCWHLPRSSAGNDAQPREQT